MVEKGSTVTAMAACIEIPNSATAPARARRWLREELGELSGGIVGDICLLASELVTNSHLHTNTERIRVSFECAPGTLRLEVGDDGMSTSSAWVLSKRRDYGRGLNLVAEIASDWGIHWNPKSTKVWATLQTLT